MSENAIRILVVDDDAGLRALLRDYLAREGFQVAEAENGRAMQACMDRHETNLIILDLMLPGDDGLTLTRRLRAKTDVPIIMLSARGDEVDRIVGLEVGADDYLAKPFNPRELLARIRAVMRRQVAAREIDQAADERIRFGPYELDPVQHELRRGSQLVGLTSGEFELLRVLAEHPDRVLDRDRLLDLIKGYERSPFDRSIDVQIARLRAKIESETKNPRFIRTIWGRGYMFTPAGEA